MIQEFTRERQIVLEGTLVEKDQLLEVLHADDAVTVDAAGAIRNLTRDEKVGREIDTARDAGVQQVVEFRHAFGQDARAVRLVAEHALIVMDAQRIVARTNEAVDQLFGGGCAHVIRREAEVDAVETLGDAGLLREFEVLSAADDASVFARGRFNPSKRREVERRARHDLRRILHRHPDIGRFDCERTLHDLGNAVRCGNGKANRPTLARLESAVTERKAQRKVLAAPLAVILKLDGRVLRQAKGELRAS